MDSLILKTAEKAQVEYLLAIDEELFSNLTEETPDTTGLAEDGYEGRVNKDHPSITWIDDSCKAPHKYHPNLVRNEDEKDWIHSTPLNDDELTVEAFMKQMEEEEEEEKQLQ